MSKSKSVLIIGKVWPEPNSSAAGSRMVQLIELFNRYNWKVYFGTAAAISEYSTDLEELKTEVVPIELNKDSFNEFISDLNPDAVIFDRFMTEEQFGWRVAEFCPSAIRILDTEDLHSLRMGRQKALKEERSFKNSDLISVHSKREIASIYRCDLSLIISEFEMEILGSVFKVDKSLFHYSSFMLDPIEDIEIELLPEFEDRLHFISIGNFLHEPNWATVLHLKKTIWPKIKAKLQEAELHIYGAYPTQKVFELNSSKEGFIIKGRASNSKEVMSSARICLAPIRFGAGLKGKLIESMQCGTPNITSSIGAEGMQGNLEWNGVITDNPDDFAKSAVELYTNKEKWISAQNYGFDLVNRLYPKKKIGDQLMTKIETIKLGLNLHREQNFTGQMLLHHTISGTKYMSKWIEEKNK